MQFFEKNGVLVRGEKELFVDAVGVKGKTVLVSHAHSDHARPTPSNTYFMTPQTSALVGALNKNVSEVVFGKKFFVEDFEISLHPSGHILGSAQIKISNSFEAAITTDFKLQKSILFDGAQILPCDTLVIESTFGLPSFVFPPREQVYTEMLKWAQGEISKNHFIVLCGYSTGKAQELTKFCTELLGEAPIVHEKIFAQNLVYEKFGVRLGDYVLLDNNLNDAGVLIFPPHLISDELLHAISHQLGKKVSCAIATGWKYNSRYKIFPLSDHADFPQLIEYIAQSGAKNVFTHHGFDKELAFHVQKRLGVKAMPLRYSGQLTLGEFAF